MTARETNPAVTLDARVLAHLAAQPSYADRGLTAREIAKVLTPEAKADGPVRLALGRLRKRGLVYVEPPPVGAFGFVTDGGQRLRVNATGREVASGRTIPAPLASAVAHVEAHGALLPLLRGIGGRP